MLLRLQKKNWRGFTLLELLLVIAILAILGLIVVLLMNPVELMRQARDSNRLSDLSTIDRALSIMEADATPISFGQPFTVYISVPDMAATTTAGTNCSGMGLSNLPSGWSYHCAASSTYKTVNGSGWIPVDFSSATFNSPISLLPTDPNNSTSSSLYYTYITGGSWSLTALLESQKYRQNTAISDGGYDPERVEKGSDLTLWKNALALMGYWKLDENGGTQAGDSSGNGNSGAISGSSWVSGKSGSALSFDGIDDWVNLGQNIVPSTTITVAVWAKVMGTGEQLTVGRFGYWTGSAGDISYWIKPIPSSNVLRMGVNDWGQDLEISLPGWSWNNWHHYAFTWDATSSVIHGYVDGIEVASTTYAATAIYNQSSYPVMLGRYEYPNGIWNYANQLIDDVRIYNRVLSAADIKTIFDLTK